MKIIVQRVSQATVLSDNKIVGHIDKGILALVGITYTDNTTVFEWLTNKLANLRIFDDNDGVMNQSLIDIGGEVLFVSNFTLYADTRKGFRPSYSAAAPSAISKPIYEQFIQHFKEKYSQKIKIVEGIFGAMMDIELVNNGPVTLLIEKEATL